jgi:hypothetical protein
MSVHRCSISWFYHEGEYALFLLPSLDRFEPRSATAVGALLYFDSIGKLQRQIDWKYDALKHTPLHEFMSTVTSIDSWLSFYIGLEDDAKRLERRWMCEPLTRPRIVRTDADADGDLDEVCALTCGLCRV